MAHQPYELTNDQRLYFGLNPVSGNWDKQVLSDKVTAYYDLDKIVKILHYDYGYWEYDADINTLNRQILLPQTARGKQQKLTIPRILKIKGSGVQFSGSFEGGGMHVYDNRRNTFFIKGYPEEGAIKNYQDIDNWVVNYIAKAPENYFDWLDEQLAQKRLKIKAKEGDIIAYKITATEYGFARVLVDVFALGKAKGVNPYIMGLHPRSLVVLPYAYYTDTMDVDMDALVSKKTMPVLCIFDIEVYRGQMPVVGHRPLSNIEKEIPIPYLGTSSTIYYTKDQIMAFAK